MFRGASGKQKAATQFETLVFGQELTSRPGEVFNPSQVDSFGYDGELACVAFDPLQSLLAVATKSGRCCIYGKHGVPRLSWCLRPAQAIKNVLLKAGSSVIILIDARDTLYVYDLSNVDDRGEPERLMAHSMRAGVNCIEYIPSLSHIFLGCQDGTVETLDVDRLRMSPYKVRNLWTDQDDLLRRSGIKGGTGKKRIPPCTDVKTNPLDPNQLLIGYAGGIVLYDLSEQRTIRTYEYLVLPGAPGGHNDQTEGAFLERRPSCMCLAWRPDGRMFASGHDDGSIVFWAVEDGDKPVMARTIFMEDVNMATSSSLFGDDAHSPQSAVASMREPVFKLAWSAFTEGNSGLFDRFTGPGTPEPSSSARTSTPSRKLSTGGTLLTVLGGLKPDEPKGLHVMHLPAFSAPSLLGASGAAELKAAYRTSVTVSYKSVMPTDTVPEDFTLLTSNPYYSQANDPYAVVILTAADPELPRIAPHTERGFIAYDFPPAGLAGPTELDLPVEMQLSGSQAVMMADAITLPSFAHKRLKDETGRSKLPLSGGDGKVILRSNTSAGRGGPLHHAVLTVHLDMTVRIWDYTTPTPELLDVFSVRDALSDDQLMSYLEGRMWIDKISPSWETSEIAIALSTGEVLLYRFDYAKAGAVIQQQQAEDAQFYNTPLVRVETTRLELERVATRAAAMGLNDNKSFFGRKKSTHSRTTSASQQQGLTSFEVDVVDISARSDWSKNGFKPIFALIAPKLRERRVTALSMSQAGFLAVAWNEKLAVIDLRGPELLYNEGSDRAVSGGITLLTWMTCAEGDDTERQPRLLASYGSGLNRLFTLSFVLDTWIVNTALSTLEHASLAAPLAVFAMDPHGNSLPLNGTTLEATLKAQARGPTNSTGGGALHTILIVVSEHSLTVKANITGERLLKRDFATHKAVAAQMVWRHGMPVLVVLLADGKCSIYALPKCEEIKTFRISFERARPSISPDGRILQTLSPTLFEMTTIFTDQAVSRTKCSYHDATKLLPAQPSSSVLGAATSAATSYIASWFGGEAAKAVGVTNLDDMLGGPHRPPPQIRSAAVQGTVEASQAATTGSSPGRPARGRPVAPAAPTAAAPARGGSGSLAAMAGGRIPQIDHVEVEYDRFGRVKKRHELTDALEERGERLGFVNEQLDRASTASTNFVEQARRTAMMQSGKMAITGAGKGALAGVSAGFNKLIG